MKMLMVVWDDTGGHPGWFTDEDMDRWFKESEGDYSVITIGYLYEETDKYLVLTRGWNGLGQSMDPLRINKEAVTTVEELEYAKTTPVIGNKEQERAGAEGREPVGDSTEGNLGDYDSPTGRGD